MFLFDEAIGAALRRATRLGTGAEQLVEQGNLKIDQVDPAELSPGEFVQRIRDSVEIGGSKLIVIDSLNGLLTAMPEEEHLVLHMHELLSYLNHKGVTMLLILAQAGILGPSMSSVVDLSYLADNVVLLRYFEASGEVRKAISIVKKRGGEHERTIRELVFSDSRLSVGEPLTGFRGVLSGIPTFMGVASELNPL
jgi:circadian clock protein KaiC